MAPRAPLIGVGDPEAGLYQWDFGDGVGSNLSAPTHMYRQPALSEVVQATVTFCDEGVLPVDAREMLFRDGILDPPEWMFTQGICLRREFQVFTYSPIAVVMLIVVPIVPLPAYLLLRWRRRQSTGSHQWQRARERPCARGYKYGRRRLV